MNENFYRQVTEQMEMRLKENFFTICATNLKFHSTNIPLANRSPSFNFSKYDLSSSSFKG